MVATKMKGIYKGFKYSISQMFVVTTKDREMEIGYPTDVKHLAHIGWDADHSAPHPTWMNEFQTGVAEFGASTSAANSAGSAPISVWSSQDFSESTRQPSSESDHASFSSELFPPPMVTKKKKKKQKWKKSKSSSSPKSNPSSCSRSLRVAKSISSFIECSIKPSTTTN